MQSPHVVIHKQTWHYRLFWWSLGITDAWRGRRGEYARRYEYGTSLFHYLRIIFFWMPLSIASSLLTVAVVFFFLFFLPIQIKGLSEYLGFLAALCGSFGLFQMFRYGLVRLAEEPDHLYWKRYFPGALVLARKFINAKVEGAIPNITFVGNKKK